MKYIKCTGRKANPRIKFVRFKKRIIQRKTRRKQISVKPCKTTSRHSKCLKQGKCTHRTRFKHNLCTMKKLRKKPRKKPRKKH